MQHFDEKTSKKLDHYVYALLDEGKIFYVGKGQGNRLFQHIQEEIPEDQEGSKKLQKIRDIKQAGKEVGHVIVRHGLNKNEALRLEATIIDLWNFEKKGLTNKNEGHQTIDNGIMTAEHAYRKYNAVPIETFDEPLIIININKTYRRNSGPNGIYAATRGDWTLDRSHAEKAVYGLAEYQGLIVGVFRIDQWEEVDVPKGKRRRIRFSGEVAPDEVRDKYLNKSVAHLKKRGQSFPVRYFL